MAQPRQQLLYNGQELQQSDINSIAQSAALADDVVMAELLRLAPYSSSASRVVFPMGYAGSAVETAAIVTPAGASGSVTLSPFRAVIGSRTAVGSNASLNWSDIRSGIYIGGATSLTGTVSLAANSSGNPRWDLVYAAFSPDASGSSVTRYVKNPTTKVVGTQSVVPQLVQTIVIGTVTGTPGASPAFPSAPADSGSTYYIPLALVRVPNGFSGTSTVDVRDIFDISPTAQISRTTGAASCMPANQSFQQGGAAFLNAAFAWSASAATRPSVYLPPTMGGMESTFVAVDLITPGSYSHSNGSVIDSSRDWRNRVFLVAAQAAGSGAAFAWDRSSGNAGGGFRIPDSQSNALVWQFGQSFKDDGGYLTTGGGVGYFTSATLTAMAASTYISPYVDLTTGLLKLYVSGSPAVRAFFWIFSTGPMANY